MVGKGTGCREGRAGLLCSDVRLGQKFSVKIRRSKIDQGNLGRVMLLGRELGNQIYPVQAVSVYMQERPKPHGDETFLARCLLFPRLRGFWGECSTIHSPPTLFFFFFFKVEINSRTLIPVFKTESVHSGSASRDDCGRVFPDEKRVSSFP